MPILARNALENVSEQDHPIVSRLVDEEWRGV
jgi:hypothetical protein